MGRIILILFFTFWILSLTAQNKVVISKQGLWLAVLSPKSDTLLYCSIACGSVLHNKQNEGDNRTPEGKFRIKSVENSSKWTFDFNDGKGSVKAYGPLFFRLSTPGHKGIGIHGTHLPESIPGRTTHGCIRMQNENLIILSHLVSIGTEVVIFPDKDYSP